MQTKNNFRMQRVHIHYYWSFCVFVSKAECKEEINIYWKIISIFYRLAVVPPSARRSCDMLCFVL